MSPPLAPKAVKSLMNQESVQLADLKSSPSSERRRSPSPSSVQPISSSMSSAFYNDPPIVEDAPIQDLLQSFRSIINGGTTTTTRRGKSKYKPHMFIEIAAEINKLVDALESRFQTQQDNQLNILPPAPNDITDARIDTPIDTATIETQTEPEEIKLTYAEATNKPNTSKSKTLLL
ncbi:hypothetical protein AVEN_159136-1 [Araneus ventricosus]|uniref:Uncharacterized protein n=1 Tax=Araneus ventricosus TaxID=182803 RepID=A0A4Y2QL89_ARAVE|nr:hypothetical protein AVEN_159136-1 [Araneus ventricosus]